MEKRQKDQLIVSKELSLVKSGVRTGVEVGGRCLHVEFAVPVVLDVPVSSSDPSPVKDPDSAEGPGVTESEVESAIPDRVVIDFAEMEIAVIVDTSVLVDVEGSVTAAAVATCNVLDLNKADSSVVDIDLDDRLTVVVDANDFGEYSAGVVWFCALSQ